MKQEVQIKCLVFSTELSNELNLPQENACQICMFRNEGKLKSINCIVIVGKETTLVKILLIDEVQSRSWVKSDNEKAISLRC